MTLYKPQEWEAPTQVVGEAKAAAACLACPAALLFPILAMSKYFDRHGVPLHKDDAVRLEGCGGPELEHAEGVIHSFYLMRDGKDRARVHLTGQGGRAVGVKVELLTKIHDEGPEPVFDPLLPHGAVLFEALDVPARKE